MSTPNELSERIAAEIHNECFVRRLMHSLPDKDMLTAIIARHLSAAPAQESDALCAYHGQRLIEWMDDPDRAPAFHVFTAGNERQIAYRFERTVIPPLLDPELAEAQRRYEATPQGEYIPREALGFGLWEEDGRVFVNWKPGVNQRDFIDWIVLAHNLWPQLIARLAQKENDNG